MSNRYEKSTRFLTRAEATIPIGSQTFSKSRTQYPVGISPLFATKAKGPYLWDLDGNKYIDLVSNLAAITLGYRNRKVNSAVRKQMSLGNGFSLPGTLEAVVAEKIKSLVPSAEMVRFGKNGTDATSAAIRLARAYTGRDYVAVCGYHGWQDWFIGSTSRNKGVPKRTSALTLTFKYNDIKSLEKIFSKHPKGIAAVILEPMTNEFPENKFLEKTKKLCRKYGAVLIFDETITGFRFSKGGAQEVFQVTPDLSTFGKGIANGYPLSVVCGSREIMREMENIFFSGTFGGELLSLAAANVVLGMHQKDEISPRLNKYGEELSQNLQKIIDQADMSGLLEIKGHPTWKFLEWKDGSEFTAPELKTYFMQEMFRRGILILSTHNVTLAHNEKIRGVIISKYERVLTLMKKAISEGNLKDKLEVMPLKPLFKVR
jgi:glutamate-1-semialdehyde 2,1-aminomutase